jgi:hypothetical protein
MWTLHCDASQEQALKKNSEKQKQLYCIARALGTTMCTLHCDASEEQAADFNKASSAHDMHALLLLYCVTYV